MTSKIQSSQFHLWHTKTKQKKLIRNKQYIYFLIIVGSTTQTGTFLGANSKVLSFAAK